MNTELHLEPRATNLDILLVEDDYHTARIFTRYLAHSHRSIAEASTVSAALDILAAATPPRVAVVDFYLQGETSTALIHALQPLRKACKTIVILLSAAAYDRNLPIDLALVDFPLAKPVSPRQLATLVNSLVQHP